MDSKGDADNELFHMHVGTLSLRQKWAEREVSPSLTAVVVCAIALAGFLAGVLATRAWDGALAWRLCPVMCGVPGAPCEDVSSVSGLDSWFSEQVLDRLYSAYAACFSHGDGI